MKAIEISQKTHLIRHWFRWYRVQRGGTDWQKLKIEKRVPPFNLKKTAESLAQRDAQAAGKSSAQK